MKKWSDYRKTFSESTLRRGAEIRRELVLTLELPQEVAQEDTKRPSWHDVEEDQPRGVVIIDLYGEGDL